MASVDGIFGTVIQQDPTVMPLLRQAVHRVAHMLHFRWQITLELYLKSNQGLSEPEA